MLGPTGVDEENRGWFWCPTHTCSPFTPPDGMCAVCKAVWDARQRDLAAVSMELDKARLELGGVLLEIQRRQPAGSPPPGESFVLARWVLGTLTETADRASAGEAAALDALKRVLDKLAHPTVASSQHFSPTLVGFVVGVAEEAKGIAEKAVSSASARSTAILKVVEKAEDLCLALRDKSKDNSYREAVSVELMCAVDRLASVDA